jgi:hypothetical protein
LVGQPSPLARQQNGTTSEAMASDLIIFGINAYHADAAACIVRNGQLLAAAEEERFRRIKHRDGFNKMEQRAKRWRRI